MWTLLVSSVRYALGRATYIVEETVDLVLKYRHVLSDVQTAKILEDVTQAIDRAESMGGMVGMDCDHRAWKRLQAELQPQVKTEPSNPS